MGCGKLGVSFVACEVAEAGALGAPLWFVENTPVAHGPLCMIACRISRWRKMPFGVLSSQENGKTTAKPSTVLSINIHQPSLHRQLSISLEKANVSITLLPSSNLFCIFLLSLYFD